MKTKVLTIHPTFPETDKMIQCAKVIRDGGLVIFPTETVYGIAADFRNQKAMRRLHEVKKRAADKPFSVIISRKEDVDQLANISDYHVYKIVDKFWPGPLTLVVPAKEEGKTIGLRIPFNTIALTLSREARCPLAAPSANREGEASPSTCEEALKDLEGLVEIAIDGGPTIIGKASTVVDATTLPVKVLRHGPLIEERINKVAQKKTVLFVCTGNSCRSVMAEYLLRKALSGREDVQVISAGTSVFVNAGASADTIEILKKEKIDASLHGAQMMNKIMLQKSDLIFAMTRGHREHILQKTPSVKNRVYLLKEFDNMSTSSEEILDIEDPMGKPFSVYEECILKIKEAIEKIVKLL